MPPPELEGRNTKAVLWMKVSEDEGAESVFADPVEIDVRWVETRRDVQSADGQRVTVTADLVVDREIEDGSVLWKGKLKNWRDTGMQKLLYVVGGQSADDLRGEETFRMISLAKYKGRLPTGTAGAAPGDY